MCASFDTEVLLPEKEEVASLPCQGERAAAILRMETTWLVHLFLFPSHPPHAVTPSKGKHKQVRTDAPLNIASSNLNMSAFEDH